MKTCFGCCPLHHGVSTIAIINIFWNIIEAFKHFHHRIEKYERFKWINISNSNTSVSLDDNSTSESELPDYWSDIKRVPVMSGIYMDYIFIMAVSWIVLEFISNCCLKQSTFKKLIYIAIISFEIAIIHSYYINEKKNMLNDIIQLKWKYVSRGEVVSKGVDYSSSSAFNERTSGQTQEGSRIPPYITNIKQN
eukprot:XP_016661350.1 PREDICTED: uncharacterized protein LOC100575754 isoform X2 [Acyrthosiphon pisum]